MDAVNLSVFGAPRKAVRPTANSVASAGNNCPSQRHQQQQQPSFIVANHHLQGGNNVGAAGASSVIIRNELKFNNNKEEVKHEDRHAEDTEDCNVRSAENETRNVVDGDAVTVAAYEEIAADMEICSNELQVELAQRILSLLNIEVCLFENAS